MIDHTPARAAALHLFSTLTQVRSMDLPEGASVRLAWRDNTPTPIISAIKHDDQSAHTALRLQAVVQDPLWRDTITTWGEHAPIF